jgi:serine/threonine protein kinase
MPAPATVEDFVGLVRQSGLVPDDLLQQLLKEEAHLGTPRRLATLLVSHSLLTRFQAEQLLRGKWRGFTIGKYKVLERIGSGGNSNVYLCEHSLVRRKAAIKVLPANRASNPSNLARFYREARASGALDHPNLVKAHDVGQDGNLHFLVMDYVDGSSLQQIVTRFGPLPVARAVDCIRQAALGLHRIHEGGLVHRDVKPGNILLDRGGVIRLLDLGLARFLSDEGESLTLQLDGKNVLGTADYLSPEQALNSHDVDLRTDVYSLGATFYFLLSGQTLFPSGTITQKLMWHQVRQPVPLSQRCPEVPAGLEAILMKMVAKNADHRQQSMPELILALAPWSEPVDPPPDAEMPSLSPAARTGCGADTLSTTRSDRVRRPATLLLSSPFLGLAGSDGDQFPAALGIAPTRSAPSLQLQAAGVGSRASGAAHRPLARPSSSRRSSVRLAIFLTMGIAAGTTLRCLVGQHPRAAMMEPAPTPGQLVVSRSGEPNDFASIQQALLHTRPGDRILVCAETWEEAVRCRGASLPHGVRIEGRSPTNGPVLWRAPAGHPAAEPLVQLSDSTELTLTGFMLDGQGRIQDGLVVNGACPGLCLEDLHVRGFQHCGILLSEVHGSGERPVCLRRLRFTTGRSSSAALCLDSVRGKRGRHIIVRDCRIEGPYQAALQVSGACEDVVLQHNRVHGAREGLLCTRVGGYMTRLALSENTFCTIEKAVLHWTCLPDLDHSHLQLTRNLFVNVGPLGRVDGLAAGLLPQTAERLAAGAFGNVCDRAGPDGGLLFHTTARPVELGADSSDDTHFLRYAPALFRNVEDAPGVPPLEEKDGGDREATR